MEKTLGLDLGTASIGWAIVEQTENGYTLLDKGVDIFQEGVAREKNVERPAVQDRTDARALRRHYFRRRLRKIELLKVLTEHELCPALSRESLEAWRKEKRYPLDEDFILWQRTDDNRDKNPYHDRFRCLSEELDLSLQKDRYTLGRALYHLSQRRGFLSNRKEAAPDEETGKVKNGILELSKAMQEEGCRYLGEYFYRLYGRKAKIRKTYTARNEHYLAEFRAICRRQDLPQDLQKALERAIFFQRDLKSQKGLVGKCTFEKTKSRCPVSHPHFEEFRMLQTINNIRVATADDLEERPLTQEEIETICPLFLRKSKPHFEFEEIAKKLAGKNGYACSGDRDADSGKMRFNFSASTAVSGCPVSAGLKEVFGNDWLDEIGSLYTLAEGKSEREILNDVWHALFSFNDSDKLCAWAEDRLQLDEEQAKKFAAIRLPQGYASLSLKAIDKILPFLRRGLRYDQAVFLANLDKALPPEVLARPESLREAEDEIRELLDDFSSNALNGNMTRLQCIQEHLREQYPDISQARLDRLYHPSMIETYPKVQPDAQGLYRLGSPRVAAVRNPMAMRALFRLRILINRLLREGKIDRQTKINIEFSRGLNDANRRKAIEQYQRTREAENRKYASEIRRLYAEQTGCAIEPSDNDVLKYRLWEEQNHHCLYTGQQIGITDFIGPSPRFDIEHTVPRSMGGDDSQMNKTLCENRFNREVKRGKLPSQLANKDEVRARIESLGWPEQIESLIWQISKQRLKSKNASTKEEKDRAIQRRHLLQMELDYLKGKMERFSMLEVPQGFSNRQGVDIGIIGRYARLYLKTIFERIYTVKGATTAEFRKMWGLQSDYEKKERVNHSHHCIDAITIACIDRAAYDQWAHWAADDEEFRYGEGERPQIEKPWPTFTQDVKSVIEELLVSHHTPDNLPKQSRKKWRIRGKIQRDDQGNILYEQGDTARGVLHQQTFYGAIEREGETRYVVRKPIDSLQESDIDKIVDPAVKQKVREAVDEVGFKTAVDAENYTIWMNREKGIPIRRVRIFTPTVTQPIHLKKHRDLSDKKYKQDYHVANDGNYCMAIYEGADAKGKIKRSFKTVSNLDAARYFKASTDKAEQPELIPRSDANDYPLRCTLKTGTMVLFYQDSPEELYEASLKELTKRLYKVTGMSTLTLQQKYFYGTLILKHHQEARPAGELKAKNGVWKIGEEYRPLISLYHTQLNALVEGYDFTLSVTGEITFKH